MPTTNTTDERNPDPGRNGAEASASDVDYSDKEALRDLVRSLDATTRRWQVTWQLMFFPSLFAFVLLAAYGFYLVYNLVEDVDKMADGVYRNMGFVAERMNQISLNLDELTGSVREISVNLDDLTGNVRTMNATLDVISDQVETMPPMLASIEDMNLSMKSMDHSVQKMDKSVQNMTATVQTMNGLMGTLTVATQHISGNVSGLNQNIGRPMSFMNNFMPW